MTDGERIVTAALLSFVFHWVALGIGPAREQIYINEDFEPVVIDLSAPDVGISLAAPITLEQSPQSPPSNDEAMDRRRSALVGYLDTLSESIHAHRRIAGEGGRLVGNALFHIVVDADGAFADVVLMRSSGDARLDADAMQAVRATSGVVRRPRILGSEPMSITLAVKYQYGL